MGTGFVTFWSLVGVLMAVWGRVDGVKKMTERFSWRTIHYEFDSKEDLQAAKDGGYLEYGNSIITSLARYGDKLFMSTPRLKPGVPSTLNYINAEGTDSTTPTLKPYPSWEMNEYYNRTSKKKTMISITNVKVDNCNRLWALDTGATEELGHRKVESPPAVFVYRLSDDTLLRKYTFKDEDFTPTSRLRSIVVDDSVGTCEKAYAYIADSSGGLIVYSWESNQSFRVEHNYFHFDPLWGNLKTGQGTRYQVSEGLQAMTLTLPRRNGHRDLLFHPLISINEFSVPTQVLQNKTLSQNFTAFHNLGDRGPNSQSSSSWMDKDSGVLLYTAVVKNALICWNTFWGEELSSKTQGTVDTFGGLNQGTPGYESSKQGTCEGAASDQNRSCSHGRIESSNLGTIDTFEESAYPADVTVDVNGTVWVLTNRWLDFSFEKKTENRIANRVYSGHLREIIRGTPCAEE